MQFISGLIITSPFFRHVIALFLGLWCVYTSAIISISSKISVVHYLTVGLVLNMV